MRIHVKKFLVSHNVLIGSFWRWRLGDFQSHHDELEAKFFEERAALEAKYQKLYEPLYTKVCIICSQLWYSLTKMKLVSHGDGNVYLTGDIAIHSSKCLDCSAVCWCTFALWHIEIWNCQWNCWSWWSSKGSFCGSRRGQIFWRWSLWGYLLFSWTVLLVFFFLIEILMQRKVCQTSGSLQWRPMKFWQKR